MKKIKKIILSIMCGTLLSIVATGCNKDMWDSNYTFTHAIITRADREQLVKIKQWTDYEDGEQIQLVLEDGSIILVNSNRVILVNSERGNFINE